MTKKTKSIKRKNNKFSDIVSDDQSEEIIIIDQKILGEELDPDKYDEYDYQWEDLENSNHSDKCLFCKGKIYSSKEIQVCFECGKLLLITQTIALKQYLLKKKDINNLKYIEYQNKGYGCTYLFLLRDIRMKAIEIHYRLLDPSKAEYAQYIEMILDKRKEKNKINKNRQRKIKEKKKIIQENHQKNCLKLRRKLKHALAKHHLEIRNDSVYCSSYINGDDDITLYQVVDMMIIMNFLYSETTYPQKLDRLHNEIKKENDKTVMFAREMGERYHVDDFRYITEDEKEELKYQAIKEYVIKNGILNLPEVIFFKYENDLDSWLTAHKKQHKKLKKNISKKLIINFD